MLPEKTFLKNHFSTVHSIITKPRQFYQDMPTSGGLKEPMAFTGLTILIISMLCTVVLMGIWAPLMSLDSNLFFIIIVIIALILYFIFTTLISILIYAIMYHILLMVVGAKGSIEATLRVICYYYAVSYLVIPITIIFVTASYISETMGLQDVIIEILFDIIILMVFALALYSLYILFVGFSQVHHISMKRVVLALVAIPTALFLLMAALVLGLTFISEQTAYFDADITPPQSNLTAPFGSRPFIDGYHTPGDDWEDTEPIYQMSKNGDSFCLAAKHDYKNLYILVEWQGERGSSFSNIYFEQDEDTNDQNLTNGRYDKKHSSYSNDDFLDDGRSAYEEQNGIAKCNYKNGFWVYEWAVPLRSEDENDIYVNKFPSNLGFAIEMINVNKNGFWPDEASLECAPECWGELEILQGPTPNLDIPDSQDLSNKFNNQPKLVIIVPDKQNQSTHAAT